VPFLLKAGSQCQCWNKGLCSLEKREGQRHLWKHQGENIHFAYTY